jgi:hypothetical protein
MRSLSILVVLVALWGGVLTLGPRRDDATPDYTEICGGARSPDARRVAILEAISRDIDAAIARRGSAESPERARREELARRLEALRPRVQSVFDEVLGHARESVRRAGAAAPAGATERVRAARLRWVDVRDPHPHEARALERGCGSDLLADDGWVDKSSSEIVLCPGLLLVAAAEGDLRDGLAFMIAHELGHAIVGPRTMEDDAAERQTESEADRWGGRILRSMLGPRRSEIADTHFLRATLEPICSPKGDATHASGAERIGTVLRQLAG